MDKSITKNESLSYFHSNYCTPVDAPAYGPLPTVYKNVTFNYVYFTTDEKNISPLLPEGFESCENPICAAFSVDVPFSSSYGPFKEMGIVVQALFKGKKVFYLPALFLDNDSAIAAGREIYGSPKKKADLNFLKKGNIFVATCQRDGIDFIRITTRILDVAKESDFIPLFPIYNLKMLPSINNPEPAIKQITSTGVENPVLHCLYRCEGTVDFKPTVATNIWKLKPSKIIEASCSVMDYEQGYGNVVYDYLKNDHGENVC